MRWPGSVWQLRRRGKEVQFHADRELGVAGSRHREVTRRLTTGEPVAAEPYPVADVVDRERKRIGIADIKRQQECLALEPEAHDLHVAQFYFRFANSVLW